MSELRYLNREKMREVCKRLDVEEYGYELGGALVLYPSGGWDAFRLVDCNEDAYLYVTETFPRMH
jgi:hypothetical protein